MSNNQKKNEIERSQMISVRVYTIRLWKYEIIQMLLEDAYLVTYVALRE